MIRHTEYKRGSGLIHPVDMEAGAKLRDARNAIGMSQEKLAEKSGITFQQVQKYEKGKNRMSLSRLWQFCEILDVSPAYFFPVGNDNHDGKLMARITELEAVIDSVQMTTQKAVKGRRKAA